MLFFAVRECNLTHQVLLIYKRIMPVTLKNRKVTARWFHALADETRLKIIERLTKGEQCVCVLTDMLEAGQSRLSFHLKTLKEAGIVTDRPDGRWVYYALSPEVFEQMEAYIKSVRQNQGGRQASCCE
jgi:ArsR family transcriptional regulator, arsenate/arsenite/antimonite-responsive transcriptional repressor